jgi:hypothetical protein
MTENAFSDDWQEQKWAKHSSREKFNLIGDGVLLIIPFNAFHLLVEKVL